MREPGRAAAHRVALGAGSQTIRDPHGQAQRHPGRPAQAQRIGLAADRIRPARPGGRLTGVAGQGHRTPELGAFREQLQARRQRAHRHRGVVQAVCLDAGPAGNRMGRLTAGLQSPDDASAVLRELARAGDGENAGAATGREQGRLHAVEFPQRQVIGGTVRDVHRLLTVAVEEAERESVAAVGVLVPALEEG